uniref:Trehalose 6-phosphate phosphatase n=1 Tax=Solanum tuberosum TaxID=4113 RepID=M1DWD8_SOLTU
MGLAKLDGNDFSIEYATWLVEHPCALEKFEEMMNIGKGKKIVILLDYDGTLSDIVPNPEEAFMTDKVQDFVKLKNVYYAGSHGLDIEVPLYSTNSNEKDFGTVENIIYVVLKEHPNFRVSTGIKVFEIGPNIVWNKGHALEYFLENLGFGNSDDVFPIYIGDDRTDEDAFKVLLKRGQGFPIVVTAAPKDTKALYSLREPKEVMEFLLGLVA